MSASEEFQLRLERVLKGIIHCKNIADNIILFSKSKNELLETLNQVFDRLLKHGLTLNLTKCQFFKEEVEFMGLIFSKNSIHPTKH